MKKYETVILINSSLKNDNIQQTITKIKNYISANAKITKTQDIGVKKLAYEVKNQKNAYYYTIEFKSNDIDISELERIYRITDEILKFIVLRIDD